MKRSGIVLALALVLTGAGCSSSDGGGGLILTAELLEQCSQEGVVNLLRLVAAVDDILGVIEGDIDDDITAMRQPPPDDPSPTYDVTAMFPYAGAANDQTLAGTLGFSSDPEIGGLMIGDTITVNLTLTSQGGPLTGSINATIMVTSDDTSEVSGTIVIRDSTTNCDFEFTISPLAPLIIVGFLDINPASQLAVNILGINISGLIDFILDFGSTQTEGTIDLQDGSQTATVNASTEGIDFDPIDVEIFPDPETINNLLGCAELAVSTVFVLEGIGEAILVALGGVNEDVEILATGPGAYDFTVTGEGTTIQGSILITGLTTADVTWTFDAPGVTGMSTSTWKLTVPLEGDPCASGAGTFSAEGCEVTVSSPDNNPLKLGVDGEITGGQVTFTATVGNDSIELTFDGDEDALVSAKINGIPVPPDALEGFGDA